MINADLLCTAMEHIDEANAEDPAGRALPYAQRMTRWLMRLTAEPSVALSLAVRAQHLQRWRIPRSSYPDGRSGYLRWRRACARSHAEETSRILTRLGVPVPLIDRVAALVRKEGLGRDEETQTLEDAACLSFLEADLTEFAREREPAVVERVVGRTWAKMSSHAHDLAYSLKLDPPLVELLGRVTGNLAQ